MSMDDEKRRSRGFRISVDKGALAALILLMAGAVMACGQDGWGWLVLIAFFLIF